MKTIIAMTLLALGAAGARAQVSVDPQDLSKLKGQMAKANVLAPAGVDAGAVEGLIERLDRDGDQGQTEDGQEARSYVHSGTADASGDVENKRMTLVESELAPPTAGTDQFGNTYTYTVMRKAFVELQGEIRRYAVLPQGQARIVQLTFTVDPATNRLMEVVKTTLVGKRQGPDGLVVDPKRSSETRLKPSDPAVLSQWKALSDEFMKSGNATPV